MRRPASGAGILVAGLALLLPACAHTGERDAGGIPQVEIDARDFAFAAPDSLPPGLVRLTLHNQGPSYHHAQLVRLPDTISFTAAGHSLRAAADMPPWMLPVGGVEGADSVARKVTVTAWLEPGRYLLLCRITTRDRTPHFALGMVQPLIVTAPAGASASALGSTSATDTAGATPVRLRDFAIEAPDTVRAGPRTLAVRNAGGTEHNLAVARLAPGATIAHVMNAPPGISPTFEVLGGTAGLAPGATNWVHLDLAPGRYVLVCFVEEPSTHREHLKLGMIRQVTVVD